MIRYVWEARSNVYRKSFSSLDFPFFFSFLLERDESRGDFLKKSNENVYIAVRRNIYFFLSFFFDLNENERQ